MFNLKMFTLSVLKFKTLRFKFKVSDLSCRVQGLGLAFELFLGLGFGVYNVGPFVFKLVACHSDELRRFKALVL